MEKNEQTLTTVSSCNDELQEMKEVWLWDISKDFKEMFGAVAAPERKENQTYYVDLPKGEIDFFIHESVMSRMDVMGKIGEYIAFRRYRMCSICVDLQKDGWTPVSLRHHNDYKRVKY